MEKENLNGQQHDDEKGLKLKGKLEEQHDTSKHKDKKKGQTLLISS